MGQIIKDRNKKIIKLLLQYAMEILLIWPRYVEIKTNLKVFLYL